jgi:hypothetical protein
VLADGHNPTGEVHVDACASEFHASVKHGERARAWNGEKEYDTTLQSGHAQRCSCVNSRKRAARQHQAECKCQQVGQTVARVSGGSNIFVHHDATKKVMRAVV